MRPFRQISQETYRKRYHKARTAMPTRPIFYECDICGHCHPWEFNGDCRDDANRFTCEQLDAKFGGPNGYELRTMSERVEQDQQS